VTSATDLTSQDEQSPDLDPSSEDERDGVTGSPQIQVNENYPSTFLTQPNKWVILSLSSSMSCYILSYIVWLTWG